jgi:hypothetical protein
MQRHSDPHIDKNQGLIPKKNPARIENKKIRDVAQLGSAPRSGRGGRRFKSFHPDSGKNALQQGFPLSSETDWISRY